MLKNVTFPAERDLLPQMVSQFEGEISKYVSNAIWLNRLKLCADEIITNIIDYSGSKNLCFSCEFVEIENALRFEFVDTGNIGGLGIFLYTTIMDKIEYRYEGGKNILTATKFLTEGVESGCEIK